MTKLKYASVCSGIEAPTMAWHSLGWEPVWFSQFDPEHNYANGPDFASAVLAHHFPNVPNLGDMTKLKDKDEYQNSHIDLLIGGTPCQSFSVAGLRGGLNDERGNLALEFCRILLEKRPKWFIWENVPGVLSSNDGKDFRTIISAFTEIRYGVAWRILDAQYFGVPQRRRRVFVVGYLGDWRPPTRVLFESESLSRHIEQGTQERQDNPFTAGKGLAFDLLGFGDYGGGAKASSLMSRDYKGATDLVVQPMAYGIREGNTSSNGWGIQNQKSHTLQACGPHSVAYAYSKSGRGGDKVDLRFTQDGKANTLNTGDGCSNQSTMNMVAQVVTQNSKDEVRYNNNNNKVGALSAEAGMKQQSHIFEKSIVRRLTPIECERLQGFPDNFTNIPWRKKPTAPNGPRYKVLGNSMAVPVIRWMGRRIEAYERSRATTVSQFI